LLQRAGLPAQILDLVRGRRPRGVPGQPLLASLQKFLRPAVIEVLDDPLAAAQLGDTVLAAQTGQNNADLLLRRKLAPGGAPDLLHNLLSRFLHRPDFCPIFAPPMATMGQNSSLPQPAPSVSLALMPDT